MGTRFDVGDVGRAESTGCVNSGRRWHRRIPSQVHPISRGHSCLWPRRHDSSGEPICQDSSHASRRPQHWLRCVSGCALTAGRPTVQELKYNPGRYQDRTVAIDGVVTSSWGLPLVPFKFYKVDDGTGEVTVVAQGGRTPTKGAHVRVNGRVSEVATFGGSSRRPAPSGDAISTSGGDLDDHRGHVVVRRRVAAPLGDGLKDRLDDLRRRQLARSPNHLEQTRRGELLARARSSLRTRRPCRTRRSRRRAART